MEYEISRFVNNNLHTIYNYVRIFVPSNNIKDSNSLNLQQYNQNYPNVYIAYEIIPNEIAINARKFLQDIIFDPKTLELNDKDNKPKNNIIKSIHKSIGNIFDENLNFIDNKLEHINDDDYYNDINRDFIIESTKNGKSDPNDWIWEKYNSQIWRATPNELDSFCSSPIIKLMDILISKFKNTFLIGPNLKKSTWVIQRTKHNFSLEKHNDFYLGRKFAFIYYLTNDNWNYKKDGGELCVYNKTQDISENEDYISINPTFNTLIVFKMENGQSPMHFIKEVKALDNNPRIALVGFFNE